MLMKKKSTSILKYTTRITKNTCPDENIYIALKDDGKKDSSMLLYVGDQLYLLEVDLCLKILKKYSKVFFQV